MKRSGRRDRTFLRENGSEVKSPGIKDIAKVALVSIGTVDRALHARPGISSGTRARILKIAERLGYRPNLAARYLKLSHQRKIAVHLPRDIASYFDALRAGVRHAAAQLQPPLEVEFYSYPRIGLGDVESMQTVLDGSCDGLILAPGSLSQITPMIRKATSRGIPVVCVATDAPDTDRLTVISSEPFTSGAIVAELLSRSRKEPTEAAIITGDLTTFDHYEKARGFRFMLSEIGSPVKLVEVVEAHDEYEEAYRKTCSLLNRYPKLSGIYVSTSNSLPVIKALEEKGRLGQMNVVLTDLFPEIVPLIRTGRIFATLYQRPLTQGRMAYEALYRFLMEGVRPRPAYRLAPYIILRSNIDLFLENSPGEIRGVSP